MGKPKTQTGLLALEASSAEITTAMVTIQTLRVSGRQLTMGTFRQLQERRLIDEERVELLGTVWGWVNYDIRSDIERHFVVQFGEELCKCRVVLRHLRPDFTGEWWPEHWPKFLFHVVEKQLYRIGDQKFNEYVSRWNALIDRLRTVEQLFIAT